MAFVCVTPTPGFDSDTKKSKIIKLEMDEIISNKDSRVLRINRWLHTMPVWQNAVVASAFWFWVFTVLGDVYSLSMCALYKFNPEEGWGNADFGFVKFQNGRVVGVEFSHD